MRGTTQPHTGVSSPTPHTQRVAVSSYSLMKPSDIALRCIPNITLHSLAFPSIPQHSHSHLSVAVSPFALPVSRAPRQELPDAVIRGSPLSHHYPTPYPPATGMNWGMTYPPTGSHLRFRSIRAPPAQNPNPSTSRLTKQRAKHPFYA